MSGGSLRVCVAHLVRRGNELTAFQAFMDSYKSQPPGTSHRLLIVFKGYSEASDIREHEEVLSGIAHERVFVEDGGFDVGTYLEIGRRFQYEFFAFFNSFSRILHPGWLEVMYRHLRDGRAGIVGATGSFQSVLTDHADLRHALRRLKAVFYRRWLREMRRQAQLVSHVYGRFPGFPNYHIRTNAFMVPRRVLDKLRSAGIHSKWDAYRFESGSNSLTRQVLRAGLQALIVGRDGEAYAPDQWPSANTFWLHEQENLLVSDNQTRAYSEGTQITRERLAFHAWRCFPNGAAREQVPPIG
jgi:hypothetical protein